MSYHYIQYANVTQHESKYQKQLEAYQKQVKAEYAETRTKLEELCERDRIHRHNLSYLECLAAKYGMDTPVKVVNEIQEEQGALAEIRDEIVRLETILEDNDSSNGVAKEELAAAKEQLDGKKSQVEIHERNITYLEDLVAENGDAVPLGLHNAIREEAERLLLARRSITKLDWRMKQLEFIVPDRVPHKDLMDEIYRREGRGTKYGPRIYRTVGQCAFNQNILCVVKWGRKTCTITSNATSGPVLDFLSAASGETGKTPELLDIPYDEESFFQFIGEIIVKREMRYYSVDTPELDRKFDFEFDPQTDLVYVPTNQQAVGGGYSIWRWRRRERRKHKRG